MSDASANYKALGLEDGASWDEVKTAFRRLARTYHPDVAGPEGKRRFAEITGAYMALKESISPGAGHGAEMSGSAAYADDVEVVNVERRPPFFRTLLRKIFSIFSFRRKPKAPTVESESEYEFDLPPARVRFIGGIITKAEDEIHSLMSRRGEMKNKAETEAILSRVSSRHPGVTLLALKRISIKDASPELRQGIVEHFTRVMPTSEVLECLLNVFTNSQFALELARALATHSDDYTDSDARMLLKWYKRCDAPKECYVRLLGSKSQKLVPAVLNAWPVNHDIGDAPSVLELLRSGDEAILVPLLKLLKREKLSPTVASAVLAISNTDQPPAVKVWASAIVREKNLG